MRLWLIRHGQTASNVGGMLDTQPPGAALTQHGQAQAAALVDLLAAETIEVVHSSIALRAQQTAAPIAQSRGLTVQTHPGLVEVAAGDWEMAHDDESVRGYLSTVGGWMNREWDLRTPGPSGTSGREVFARMDASIGAMATAGVDAIAVAHGAVLRCWASVRAANLPDTFGAAHPLVNTGVIVLDLIGDEWICRSWTGHDVLSPGDPTAEVIPARPPS